MPSVRDPIPSAALTPATTAGSKPSPTRGLTLPAALPSLDAIAQVDAAASWLYGGELENATLLDPIEQRRSASQDERVHDESKLVE